MDLNHVRLSSKLVAELYPNSIISQGEKIIEPPKTSPATDPISPVTLKTAKSWKSLGNNQKNILVLVKYPTTVYLPDHDLSFLTGIISACKLTIADIAIINLFHYPEASYKDIIVDFQSKIVFLFGIEPADFGLPMNFPHFQIQPFLNETYLFSPVLKELENDELLKRKLWACLKKIFSI